MYLNSCCALFLLALVACQASPIVKKSISEAETELTKNEINLEDAGAKKDRSKKSATTFCVEVRSGKPEQVPCRQEMKPTNVVYQPAQPQQTIHHVYSNPPAPAPAPAPTPIYNILPAPAPAPYDKPAVVQPPQPPQEIHHVHVVQPQPTPRPSVIQHEVKPIKIQEEKPVLRPEQIQQNVPITHENFVVVPPSCRTDVVVAPTRPVEVIVPQPTYVEQASKTDVVVAPTRPVGVIVPQPTYVEVPQAVYPQTIKTQEEAYECNCRPEHRILKSRISRIQDPRFMVYSSGAAIQSAPYRPSMITAEYDPSNSPVVIASEGAGQAEERHKKKTPLHLSVQVPLIYGSDNSPKYYEPSYRPATYQNSYAYPNSYTYPSSYTHPSSYTYSSPYAYGTSYSQGSYDSQPSSNVPTMVVNAGPFYRESQQGSYNSQPSGNAPAMVINSGPVYREAQHKDSITRQPNDETLSTATEMFQVSNNQKRETDPIQFKNEQQETISYEENTINEVIPKTNLIGT